MKPHRQPWLELITFAASSALLVAFVFALLFASASVAYGYMQTLNPRADRTMPTQAASASFSGVVTDQHCNAKHRLKDKSPADCTRICVSRGSHYVLVDGDSVFTLKGDKLKLDQVAGRRVTVAGNRVGDTIQVESIAE